MDLKILFWIFFKKLNFIFHWNFQELYHKVYESDEEEACRKSYFVDSLLKVQAHNELYDQGLVSYKMSIPRSADLSAEEVEAKKTGYNVPEWVWKIQIEIWI